MLSLMDGVALGELILTGGGRLVFNIGSIIGGRRTGLPVQPDNGDTGFSPWRGALPGVARQRTPLRRENRISNNETKTNPPIKKAAQQTLNGISG